MPLSLKTVPPARGPRWIGDAFRLFTRRPLAFATLFFVFLLVAVVLSVVPLLGNLLPMMLVPMLSLGFMVASQSALLGGPVKPAQFIEPLQGDPARRRSLLWLCLIYGVSALAILALCDAISGHALSRLQELRVRGGTPEELEALMSEPGVTTASLVGLLLGTLLSVPFWHAPALVHWGGQGVAQSLFSSAVAIWRSKGAFLGYALGWAALVAAFGIVSGVVLGVFGLAALASVAALPAMLLFTTVFYVSLLFTFNDSFGSAAPAAASAASDAPAG